MREDTRRRVRSYRRVWKIERALHSIPLQPGRTWRLPFPISLRGFTYFVLVAATVALLDQAPVIGAALDRLTFSTRYLLIPGVLAYLGTLTKIDGRHSHVALRHLGRWRRRSRMTSAGREMSRGGIRR